MPTKHGDKSLLSHDLDRAIVMNSLAASFDGHSEAETGLLKLRRDNARDLWNQQIETSIQNQ